MQPEHGVRFTLRLSATTPLVVYQLRAELNGLVALGQVTLDTAEGRVAIEADRELPEWTTNTVKRLLRSLWRERRLASHAAWPRRLTRWRQPEQTREQ